jgi:hypothetical protein
MKHLVLFAFILFLNPVDKSKSSGQTLFKIGRSKDANEIFYKANTDKSGNLNKENPIEIYWIKYTDNNKIEPLTWIQRNYSYGLTFIENGKERAVFQFVSYDKRSLTLKKDKKGNFKIYILSGKKEVELNRVFIPITGGTFWFPEIKQVEIYYTNPDTGKAEFEIMKP